MKKIENIEQSFKVIDESLAPGFSILVLKENKVIWENSFGFKNLVTKTKNDSSTNYNLCSLSKQFTALGILLLTQENDLHLDDKACEYLPELSSNYARIKISDLIYHSSGLPDYFQLVDGKDEVYNETIINALVMKNELNFASGARYEYSNSGYVLLSEIIQRISGDSFSDFIEERFFKKLGMSDSFVFCKKNEHKDPKRAIGYGEWPIFAERDKSNFNFNFGDGGIYSNINDFKKWISFLNDPKELFNGSSQKLIFQSGKSNSGQSLNYAFGFGTSTIIENEVTVQHSGSWLGFRSFMVNFPRRDLWFVYLSNCAGINAYETTKIYIDELIKKT